MAWWYQVNHIEHDTSSKKKRSEGVILSEGYSSTYAEEVMSTFTEAISQTNPGSDVLDELIIVADEYPFFVEEMLNQRKPVSAKAEKILKNKGFL